MSYNDDMPVIGVRVKRYTKKLLNDLAKNEDLALQVFCRKILENYLKQGDMFELVFKAPEEK